VVGLLVVEIRSDVNSILCCQRLLAPAGKCLTRFQTTDIDIFGDYTGPRRNRIAAGGAARIQGSFRALAKNNGPLNRWVLSRSSIAKACRFLTERAGLIQPEIRNLLTQLYLHLKASDLKDLARLVDVLKLHGFLPSFDAR
jgi:hypothetical protein